MSTFSDEKVDELLAPDKDEEQMETDDKEDEPDNSSVANSDSFHSVGSNSGGPSSQRTISSAYKAVRAAKLASLPSRCLATGSTRPLTPVGAILEKLPLSDR